MHSLSCTEHNQEHEHSGPKENPPREGMFPGAEHLDGTVEGALRVALEAYP